MRTTIDFPDVLYREAKMLAVKRGTTLKSLIIECLQAGLHSTGTISGIQEPVRRGPPPVGIRKIPGRPATQPMSNRQLAELMEEQDLQAAEVAKPGLKAPR